MRAVRGSRRALLAGDVMAGPDGELIKLCAAYDALEGQWREIMELCATLNRQCVEMAELCAAYDAMTGKRYDRSHLANPIADDESRDQLCEPLRERQADLLDPILALKATTVDGYRARARTIVLHAPDLIDAKETHGTAEKMVAALLRDLVGKAPASPDAELLSLLEAYNTLELQRLSFHSGGATPIEDDDARAAAIEPIGARQDELFDQFVGIAAKTTEGVLGKLQTLCFMYPDLANPDNCSDMRQFLLASLLRDVGCGEFRR